MRAALDRAGAWSWWAYRALLLGLLVWVAWQRLGAVWPFTIDDAGISYAYAKHIAEGAGPVAVIGGPRVEGYSNPLWVFLLVPWHWLGLDIPAVAKVLGVVCFAATALLSGAALAQRREGGWRSAGALEVALGGALVSCVQLSVWVVAGLENSLFWALLAALWYLDGRESQRPGAFGCSGLVALGLCITRPEAVLYVAPWAALQLLQAWREPAQRRRVRRALLLFVVPFLLYLVLHYLVFRAWVPNTFYAKTSSWSWQEGVDYLTSNLRASGLSYVLPLALLGLWGRARLELLLACHCLTGVAFILYAGGDWMPHGRFLSLVAPALLLLAACGVEQLLRALRWALRGRLAPGGAALEVVSLGLCGAALWGWWSLQARPLREVARNPWCHFCERVTATRAVRKLSRQAGIVRPSLLTQDFGGPAWLSSEWLYPIDFLGLCDRNVALLRHSMVAQRSRISKDFRFFQHFFHEQPWAPSWISLPSNFWGVFSASPEYRWDYLRLDWRQIPHARSPYFALHRGELIDYFPEVPRAEFRPLSPSLALNGAAYLAPREARGEQRAGAGVRVTVLLSLLARARLVGDEQVLVRVDAGQSSVQSEPQPLLRGLRDIAPQLGRGEPLRVELTMALPEAAADRYRVQLGVVRAAERHAGASPAWSELEPLVAGAVLAPEQRTLPPYPAALPAARSAELRALRARVSTGVEQRRRSSEPVAPDAELVARLLQLGRTLEQAGDASDAYLAYVWATQLDPRAWEQASDPVFRVRQVSADDRHTLELALLQEYYTRGTPEALAALIAFYLDGGHVDEARYFARLRSAPLRPELEAALESARVGPGQGGAVLSLVARDPLGGALDFEVEGLAGWQGDVAAFHGGPPTAQGELAAVRGHHGRGALSSGSRQDARRGTITSPPFLLQGRLLSVLVGGGSRRQRVGVELLVDDTAVESAVGLDGDFLFPWLWDVSSHQGKTARLRVFDRSKDAHVLVDRVLLWD